MTTSDQRNSLAKAILLGFMITFFSLVSIVGVVLWVYHDLFFGGVRYIANYKDMRFDFGDEFYEMHSGEPIANISIKLPNGTICKLPELSEDQAWTFLPEKSEVESRPPGDSKTHFRAAFDMAVFSKGKLIMISLSETSGVGFDFDGSGRFEMLPISKAKLYKLIGKPVSWSRIRDSRP